MCIVILYFAVPEPPAEQSSVVYKQLVDSLHPKGKSVCEKVPPIYYVKIHKTGSSTLQNILYRIGLRQNLFFALFACPYGMTYPNPPKEEYTYSRPTADNFTEYHFITDHTMFDNEAYKSYMPDNTKVITLLRHPLKQLKSTFRFWNLPLQLGIPSYEDVIGKFLRQPGKYEKTRNSFGCPPMIQISQTKNPQSHHLGLKNPAEVMEKPVEEFIEGLDKNISLVLLLERFEESLILMKRMFCLETKDIVHLSLFSTEFFSRHTYDYKKSDEIDLISRHRRYSTADYLLYEHFEAKLDHTIKEEGAGFQVELKLFQGIKHKVRQFCNESCTVFSQLVIEDVDQRSKLGFYVPFNSQGHIGTGPQNCHLWDSNPQR